MKHRKRAIKWRKSSLLGCDTGWGNIQSHPQGSWTKHAGENWERLLHGDGQGQLRHRQKA